jgi:GNAT superfamily N-acetyltransferase
VQDREGEVAAPALVRRAARFEDVAEALRLIERAVERGCRDHYGPAERRAVVLAYAHHMFVEVPGPFDTVVAHLDGRLVGVAQLDPATARLRALFIDAEVQGAGLGRVLLADVEARAARHGCARLHGAMSLNAVPFYAKAGFRPCAGPTRLGGRPAVAVLPMEKPLR